MFGEPSGIIGGQAVAGKHLLSQRSGQVLIFLRQRARFAQNGNILGLERGKLGNQAQFGPILDSFGRSLNCSGNPGSVDCNVHDISFFSSS